MQRLEKTEAIVLRVIPYSETSQIVTWMTPERGRVTTMVKGAQRRKSRFLGQYDSFYTCELVYYAREHSDMHIARECYPLKLRRTLRTDWRAMAVASYAADLVSRASLEGGHQSEMYDLLEQLLDHLCDDTTHNIIRHGLVFWFELQLLSALGLAPDIRSCSVCGNGLEAGVSCHYSHRKNGCICANCPSTDPHSETPLRADVLALLRVWKDAHTPYAVRNTICTSQQCFALRNLFDTLLGQLALVSTQNRPIVEEVLSA